MKYMGIPMYSTVISQRREPIELNSMHKEGEELALRRQLEVTKSMHNALAIQRYQDGHNIE